MGALSKAKFAPCPDTLFLILASVYIFAMIDLRDMNLLSALARHRHFARAAADMGISQPAFSARIAKIEADLGVRIVHRGNRFEGFTDEGEVVLRWSRRMLREADSMAQDLQALHGPLTGTFSLGVVPTALAHVARAPSRLHVEHPGLRLRLLSNSSNAILRGLDDHSLSAGVTYLDTALPDTVKAIALYQERYVLLCPPALAPRPEGTITWAEAATLPLCLLTRDMHNRQILDAVFARAGAAPDPVMETNAFTTALAQITAGFAATIVPESMSNVLPRGTSVTRLALTAPDIANPIGLVIPNLTPIPPSTAAVLAVLQSLS